MEDCLENGDDGFKERNRRVFFGVEYHPANQQVDGDVQDNQGCYEHRLFVWGELRSLTGGTAVTSRAVLGG